MTFGTSYTCIFYSNFSIRNYPTISILFTASYISYFYFSFNTSSSFRIFPTYLMISSSLFEALELLLCPFFSGLLSLLISLVPHQSSYLYVPYIFIHQFLKKRHFQTLLSAYVIICSTRIIKIYSSSSSSFPSSISLLHLHLCTCYHWFGVFFHVFLLSPLFCWRLSFSLTLM